MRVNSRVYNVVRHTEYQYLAAEPGVGCLVLHCAQEEEEAVCSWASYKVLGCLQGQRIVNDFSVLIT